ncbi:hypothetical protein HMPREF9120_01842 [Neisseria sp. oral taxon 020 str. F0370]|nr:hypothetical protein HMPREF9120_01842 [Neisseria sp. oral taxon 020 str. F0370]
MRLDRRTGSPVLIIFLRIIGGNVFRRPQRCVRPSEKAKRRRLSPRL